MIEGPAAADDVFSSVGGKVSGITHVRSIRTDENGLDTESTGEGLDLVTGVGAEDVEDGETLGDLGEVSTGTEGSLVSQFTDTSAAWIALIDA